MEEMTLVSHEIGDRKFSILIPIYNGVKYLESLRLQLKAVSGVNVQIVIVNDGSTDISDVDFVEFFKWLPNCKIVLKEHTGLVDTLNIGIQSCLYEFIARFDADDEFDPGRFILQYDYMIANEDISAVFCDYEFISNKGQSLGIIPSAVLPDLVKLSLINPQRTPHPGVMYRKSKVLEVGGYKSNDFPAEDLGLWIRMVELGKLGSIPAVLIKYKLNSTGISSTRRTEMKSKTIQMLKKFSFSISNEEFFRNALNQRQIYSQYTRGSMREILTFRDLIKLLYIGKMPIILKCKFFFKILLSLFRIRFCAPLFLLYIQSVYRGWVRRGLFH